MKILLLGNKSIHELKLPSRVEGSFFFPEPITNENLFIVEALNNKWVIFSSSDAIIKDMNNNIIKKDIIGDNDYYYIENENRKNIIYCQKSYDSTFKMYKVNGECELSFGQNANCKIIYNGNPYIKDIHFNLIFKNSKWVLKATQNSYIYVNEKLIMNEELYLKNGDYIYVFGLKIVVANGFLFINNPNKNLKINTDVLTSVIINEKDVPYEEVKEIDYYKNEDYYFNTPRIRRFVETYNLSIANPPNPVKEEDMPAILKIGPMITMGMISVLMLVNTLINVISGTTTFAKSWTRILTSCLMLVTSLLWPNLTKNYQKKKKEKQEKERKEKYLLYLEDKRQEIIKETVNQTNILRENLLLLKDCYETITNKRRTLWEKKISQKDFLTVRVGTGDIAIDMEINFSEDDFVIEKDILKETATKMVDEAKMIHNVPIGYSFFRKQAVAIMGKENVGKSFINNILLQLLAYHSYDELKIVIFTNEENRTFWDVYKNLPHMFSNDKSIRFYSYTSEDDKYLSNYLEQEFLDRVNKSKDVSIKENESKDEDTNQKETYIPYYLIITDDYLKIRKLGICENVFNEKQNYGFSFILLDSRLSRLPSSCTNFIMLDKPLSSILRNDGENYYQQVFYDEIDDSFDMVNCITAIANIPIEFEQDLRYLPTTLGFLEMYNVGKIEQLNVLNRWKLNDPTQSLRAIIGIDDQANHIYLDLHEKYHGPHGLIAGTTGSGKSEFIITYILSMAINYSPNEVSFILIDYKGGGLAGAFENKKNNIRLPHLAGTITNLDKNELNRTLVSIQSELKRRQSVFNEARDFLGESTIDIYKYQKFFREGRLKDPMPHLFIICDEFAELKSQQPGFMDNLISAARIGRSLGVHLILATQKPSGVVNDQIWSNTKFRVCLKVADKGDSNEIIKCPDAAELKNAGRFFLQVGVNEIFVLGQSGWCGIQYEASDVIKKDYDRSISFINDLGMVLKNLSDENLTKKKKSLQNGDELGNILKYITELANRENIKADNLWLDSMPGNMYLQDVIEKYSFTSNEVVAIIGEYDDPASQYQNILTVNLNKDANTLVYSLSATSREMFLRAIIYSSASLYSSEDINFYILDFGSETFQVFNKLPHVGDVVFSTETDKIEKLIDMLLLEIEKRKKLFLDYNGDYNLYNSESKNKKLPIIAMVINNYEAFYEIYSHQMENFTKLSREGKRYGIFMIITTSSSSGMYSRLTKNFDHKFVLDMNSKEEYSSILGRIGDVYPAEFPGRGLFKDEIAYEFQTAKICDDNNLNDFIKAKAEELCVNNPKAKPIPILPDVVTIEHLKEFITTLKSVPIGLYKDNLKPCLYNFLQDRAMLISSNEIESCFGFLKNLLRIFKKLNAVTVLFDFNDVFEKLKGEANAYCHNNFPEFLQQILIYARDKIMNTNYHIVLIIVGLDKYVENIPTAKIEEINRMLKKLPNSTLIYIDNMFRTKKYMFESWFTEHVYASNGIWVGPGVSEQSVLRAKLFNKRHNAKIDNNFGWVFNNTNTELVKLINSEDNYEE